MDIESKYKYWQIFNVMPEGFAICKTSGSPLAGHVFITNGKSVINGQVRALLKIDKKIEINDFVKHGIKKEIKDTKQVKNNCWSTYENSAAKTVNDLARARLKQYLLNDLLIDLTICEIEGWNKLEYINELKKLIEDVSAPSIHKNNIC